MQEIKYIKWSKQIMPISLLHRLIKETATASEYALTFSGNVASYWLAALARVRRLSSP